MGRRGLCTSRTRTTTSTSTAYEDEDEDEDEDDWGLVSVGLGREFF